jgi:prepilin-type N-terminal cleavage/methylation domain-containing protein
MTRTSKPMQGDRRGFTLIEMVIVMTCLSLILALIGVTMVECLRIQEQAARSSNELAARSALADRFRNDVAHASAVPDKLQEQAAGAHCLILRTGDGKDIVYRWEKADAPGRRGQLERTETAGRATSAQTFPVGDENSSVQFARSAAGKIVTLRLTDVRPRSGEKHVTEFDAAVGGDLR